VAQGPRPRSRHGRSGVQLGGLEPSRLSAGGNSSVDGRILGQPLAAKRGRNTRGLRSSSCESACALKGRATRSGTRRLKLRMPRGWPRGLPEFPSAKRPCASRARGGKRSGASGCDSWIPTPESSREQDGAGESATISGMSDRSSDAVLGSKRALYVLVVFSSRAGFPVPSEFGRRKTRGLWLRTMPRDSPKHTDDRCGRADN